MTLDALRLGFVCPEYPPAPHGGIGRFVKSLAGGLATAGHSVFVLAVGEATAQRQENGINVQVVQNGGAGLQPHFAMLRRQWVFSRQVRSWVQHNGLDLVEIPDWKGPAAMVNATTPLPCPVVVRLHGCTAAYGTMTGRRVSALVRQLEGMGLRTATHRVAVSACIDTATRAAFPRLPPSGAVIHNGVGDEFLAEPPECVRRNLLFVGRVSHNKGADILFRELPAILAGSDADIDLVGKDTNEGRGGGSYLEELIQEIAQPLRQRIRFHGWTEGDALRRLYAGARCAVFPSTAEAFGLVALEAMACGTPVVVPQGSCFCEFVQDRIHGRHFQRCVPGDLADVALEVMRSGQHETLGRSARQHVLQNYATSNMLQQNIDFYRKCLSRWVRA